MADVEVGQARLVGVLLVGTVWGVFGADSLKTYYMTDYCSDSFSLQSHNVTAFALLLTRNATYSPNMMCDMKVFAPIGHGLMFLFTEINVHNCHDYADVYERHSDVYMSLNPEICDMLPEPLVTSRFHAVIGFNSDREGEGRGFKVIITAFHTDLCNKSEEFRCTNQRCIDSSLKCSGYDNCGDNSNNDDCRTINSTLIILVTCGLVSVISIIGVLAIYCRRKYGTGHSPNLTYPNSSSCSEFPTPSVSRWFRRWTESQTEDTSLSCTESSRDSVPSSTNNRTSQSLLPSPPPYTRRTKPGGRHIPNLYPDPPPSYEEVQPPSYEDAVRNV